MSKNNTYTKDLIAGGIGALFVYIGGHLQYNSGAYLNMTDFIIGLLFVIFGAMILGVALNKISTTYKSGSMVVPKKGKKSNDKTKK